VRQLRIASTATLLTLVALGSSARASSYSQVLRSYEAHGSVPACQFSSQQLETALKGVDTYGAQYFSDFTGAVQNALASRASGACSATAAQPATAAAAARSSNPPLVLGPLTGATGASLPAPMLMAALAAVIGLLGTAVALAWWLGWSPAWAGAWRHAFREAGYRSEATWSEFEDWLRSH
jgi:hypothetical protein